METKFIEMIKRVKTGKVAKIAGTRGELQRARKAIGSLIDDRITVCRGSTCLYVFDSLRTIFVDESFFPRQ